MTKELNTAFADPSKPAEEAPAPGAEAMIEGAPPPPEPAVPVEEPPAPGAEGYDPDAQTPAPTEPKTSGGGTPT